MGEQDRRAPADPPAVRRGREEIDQSSLTFDDQSPPDGLVVECTEGSDRIEVFVLEATEVRDVVPSRVAVGPLGGTVDRRRVQSPQVEFYVIEESTECHRT